MKNDTGSTCNEKVFKTFKIERLRLDRERYNIDFLLFCKARNITPKFLRMNNKLLNKDFNRQIRQFEMTLLKRIIRKKFAYINHLEKKCLNLFYKLNATYTSIEVNIMLNKIEAARNAQNSRKQFVIDKKVFNLHLNDKNIQTTPKPVPFLNLSSKIFTERETKLLELGPKFIFKQDKLPLRKFIPQIECILENIQSNKEELRYKIYSEMKKFNESKQLNSTNEMSIIKNIKKDESIRIIATDKSNKIAILNKADYESKMMDTILSMNCIEVTRNPINTIITKTKQLINDVTWPDNVKQSLKLNDAAIIPTIFAKLKDHKKGYPLRPIVPKCMGPTYRIEKVMATILQNYLPPTNHVLNSTTDFIQKIRNLRINSEHFLASFDIISLFPSIDIQQAIQIIDKILDEQGCTIKTTIIAALNLIANSNYFQFNKRFFKQMKGAPMGSPLSSTLAEFILRPIENIIHEQDTNRSLRLWLRYVDDIFIIWNGNKEQLLQFKEEINKIDKNIKFTIETEINDSINFLDVSLTKKNNGTIERRIYRKPTAITSIIPNTANAPNTYKMAAFNAYIRRAQIVCSKKQINTELSFIENIAEDHGYHKNIVRKIHHRHKFKPPINNSSDQKVKYAGQIDFYPKLTHRIQKLLQRENYTISISNNNNLYSLLKHDRDTIEPNDRNGIYQIPFIDQNNQTKFYIGVTKRKLIHRKKEHQSDIKYNRLTTALARLYNRENIKIDFNNMKIITSYINNRQALIAESIEIILRKDEICNEETSYDIPKIWHTLLQSNKQKLRQQTTDGNSRRHEPETAQRAISLDIQ